MKLLIQNFRFHFHQYPLYLKRLIWHILFIKGDLERKKSCNSIFEWMMDLFFYLADVAMVTLAYDCISYLWKFNSKPMPLEVVDMGRKYFGNSIMWEYVKINPKMFVPIRQFAIAYVSLNTINYRDTLVVPTLVHELVHVWQYQRYGSMYIGRALRAQFSVEGYQYGGLMNLYRSMIQGKKLIDFNFEQQADIIEDGYKLLVLEKENSGEKPLEIAVYQYFMDQLKYDKCH